MDFQLQLAQREQEWDQERERRETEHNLRMETMRIQHNREIEMREREFHGTGHQLFHLDVGGSPIKREPSRRFEQIIDKETLREILDQFSILPFAFGHSEKCAITAAGIAALDVKDGSSSQRPRRREGGKDGGRIRGFSQKNFRQDVLQDPRPSSARRPGEESPSQALGLQVGTGHVGPQQEARLVV